MATFYCTKSRKRAIMHMCVGSINFTSVAMLLVKIFVISNKKKEKIPLLEHFQNPIKKS
jgi:hypothetical protein